MIYKKIYQFKISSTLETEFISIVDYKENENINFEERKNYSMLYDGTAETQEEKEAVQLTNGWTDVTTNNISRYGTGEVKITKEENYINFLVNNNGGIASVAINKNIGEMDFYKIYIKCTGVSSTTAYTGYSITLDYLNVDPTKNKFSIYGNNDNRIDSKNYSIYYKGAKYTDEILSTYKPLNKEAYLCIYSSVYSNTLNKYSYSSNMQNCWVVGEDDYNKLGNYAKIQENYTDIKEFLTEENIIKICNSKEATEYMIKQCTGNFMCELLADDELIDSLTVEVKKKIKENENWNKFIEIYGKQEKF